MAEPTAPRCPLCLEVLPSGAGPCPACGAPPPGPAAAPDPGATVPRRGFFRTWAIALFRPGTLFSTPPEAFASPLRFAGVLYGALLIVLALFFLGAGYLSPGRAALFAGGTLVLGAALVAGSIVLSAALAHVIGGARRPFAETLSITCYTAAPAYLGVLRPLNWLWSSWILFVGLRRRQGASAGRAFLAAAATLLVPVCTALFLRTSLLEAFKIPAGSMVPTLQVGDHIFVNKFIYGMHVPFTKFKLGDGIQPPRRGDVAVFIYPKEPDKDFIKRIIAVAGDTVDIRGGQVYINGEALRRTPLPGPCEYEDYNEGIDEWQRAPCEAFREENGGVSYTTIRNPGAGDRGGGLLTYPLTVPPRSVFVMGDNRDNSHDSRYWGFVPYDLLKGRAWIIWWSKGKGDTVRFERVFKSVR